MTYFRLLYTAQRSRRSDTSITPLWEPHITRSSYLLDFFWPVAEQPNSGVGYFIGEVTRPRTIRHEHPTERLWMSDQLATDATTYATHNKHERQTSMPSMRIEPATPAIKQVQNPALDCTATRIGWTLNYLKISHKILKYLYRKCIF